MTARSLLPIALLTAGIVFAEDAVRPEIDNAWVRVTRVKADAGASQMDSVFVSLAGQAAFVPAGAVPRRDAGEAVRVELKPRAPKSAPVALDPVKLDPEHHIVLLENPRVRVIRTILEPHLKAPMHEHPHYVVVYMTELHTAMQLSDGKLVDNVRHPGEIAWRDFMRHATENVGDRSASEIQVELK